MYHKLIKAGVQTRLAQHSPQSGAHRRTATMGLMQVLLAGGHKFLLLELDPDFIANIAKQAGFEYRIEESQRSMNLHLSAVDRQSPLLLFDAADPGNLGWFSRCQFYVA